MKVERINFTLQKYSHKNNNYLSLYKLLYVNDSKYGKLCPLKLLFTKYLRNQTKMNPR